MIWIKVPRLFLCRPDYFALHPKSGTCLFRKSIYYLINFIFLNLLHCVVGHRKNNTFPDIVDNMKKYDIIAGKIADDATNVTILTYLVGAYGTIGSTEADNFCINRLIPERLKNQFCFRTINSLKCLSLIESEQIWKN